MTLTFQQILEGITRHRANPVNFGIDPNDASSNVRELKRKLNEIEWALQALAEKLRDESNE